MKFILTARHLFIAALVVCLSLSTLNPTAAKEVKAQESSENKEENSSSPSATETTRKLRERIERVVQEKKTAVEGVLSEVNPRQRGFIGQVQRVSEEAITVKTQKGTQIIPYNQNVDLRKNGKAITIGDVAVDDWVVVLGITESDTFMPKRIMVSGTSLRPRDHRVYMGSIAALTKSQIKIVKRSDGQDLSMTLTEDTKFEDQHGETIKSTELSEDIQVMVIGYQDDKGQTVTLIRALAPLDQSN